MDGVNLELEFCGGCEFLVGNQKKHKVSIPCERDFVTMAEVIVYVRDAMLSEVRARNSLNSLQNCDRPELLIQGDTVRPGVLVLVNECDWELTGYEKTELQNGDEVTFISTLHGG